MYFAEKTNGRVTKEKFSKLKMFIDTRAGTE